MVGPPRPILTAGAGAAQAAGAIDGLSRHHPEISPPDLSIRGLIELPEPIQSLVGHPRSDPVGSDSSPPVSDPVAVAPDLVDFFDQAGIEGLVRLEDPEEAAFAHLLFEIPKRAEEQRVADALRFDFCPDLLPQQ